MIYTFTYWYACPGMLLQQEPAFVNLFEIIKKIIAQ